MTNHDESAGRPRRSFPWTIVRRFCLGFGLAGSLAVLGTWLVRPGRLLEWWGVMGFGGVTPLNALANWYRDGGPWTLSGLCLVFPGKELLVLAALLFLVLLFVFLLIVEWGPRRLRQFEWQSLGPLCLRMLRMRSRSLLVLIALLGLYLGWEITAWRAWRLQLRILSLAADYGRVEHYYRYVLRKTEEDIDRRKRNPSFYGVENETEAARAAEQAYRLDQLREEAAEYQRRADAMAALRRKYESAAAAPGRPIALVGPSRELPHRSSVLMTDPGPYLANCKSLLQRYPDLVWAHRNRAWVLATCPDPRFRNGKQALIDAVRAADLTNWKDGPTLSVLAAAYAEIGDFPAAARWEKARLQKEQQDRNQAIARWKLEHPRQPYRGKAKVDRTRLNRYKAKMPYRNTGKNVGYW